MVARRCDRHLTVRLSQTEWELFEEARRAIHARGVIRGSPTKADTIGLLAAALCYRAGQGGYVGRAPHCRAALAAWERERFPHYLQMMLGGWLGPLPDGTVTTEDTACRRPSGGPKQGGIGVRPFRPAP